MRRGACLQLINKGQCHLLGSHQGGRVSLPTLECGVGGGGEAYVPGQRTRKTQRAAVSRWRLKGCPRRAAPGTPLPRARRAAARPFPAGELHVRPPGGAAEAVLPRRRLRPYRGLVASTCHFLVTAQPTKHGMCRDSPAFSRRWPEARRFLLACPSLAGTPSRVKGLLHLLW